MNELAGRVAIITGAGRGIGREHALLFAAEGAAVVVNDLGGAQDGSGQDATPAQQVVDEIVAAGGAAIANYDDVADADGAQRMIDMAIETFDGLDVLVNNAGILRDRTLVNMTEAEWDAVIHVHLRGHFLPSRAAAQYWRNQSKAGKTVAASVINTSSTSGILSNPGQSNYGAAKAGIASMTEIMQKELGRYGVRANAICPAARTRLTMSIPGAEERDVERRKAAEQAGFDKFSPDNISPLVAYLATANCPIKGKVFFVYGGGVALMQPWHAHDTIEVDHKWSISELAAAADKWGSVEWDYSLPFFDPQ
jgi:NAD(P)-dependent dehydrogenase (short-subunit alcohol dehydrogenase family)